MISYSKVDYSYIKDWKFLPNPIYRDQCDHVWVMEFTDIRNEHRIIERRCERFAKFQNGDILLCGYHTPGYGRKGRAKVPRDPVPNGAAKLRKFMVENLPNHAVKNSGKFE